MEHSPIHHRDDGSSRSLQDGWKQINWPTLAGGAMIGIIVMQFFIGRPLTQRIDSMHEQMSVIDTHLVELTGSRDDVRRTNDLLTGLKTQHDQLVAAQATVVRADDVDAGMGGGVLGAPLRGEVLDIERERS